MHLATIADGNPPAASWGRGREAVKTHPEFAFGWVLVH